MGRFLNRADLENSTRVCVLNYAAASDLIGYADCIGEELSFNGVKFTVVGVLSEEENLMSSMMGGSYDLSDEAFLRELIASAKADGKESGLLKDYHLRYLVCMTPKEEILVFSDTSSETRAMEYLLTNCLLIGAGGLALFLVVRVLLARWAFKPVERAWEQQKQFVADASHELKTPLTVILTDPELLQSGACTEADKTRFLGSIRAMGEQMRGLVEELLSLTRADKARSMNHSYGLWLAIARQIAESHKGKIWAESAGGINRFCVQLPAE